MINKDSWDGECISDCEFNENDKCIRFPEPCIKELEDEKN